MNKFNYVLNDLALSNLLTKCLYAEDVTREDKEELINQFELIQLENKQLRETLDKARKTLKETIHIAMVDPTQVPELMEVLGVSYE